MYGPVEEKTCGIFIFLNDTATTEIYTLSLHDALPICVPARPIRCLAFPGVPADRRPRRGRGDQLRGFQGDPGEDRKSTRLNSSHSQISYAVFCLKTKTP